MDRTSMSKQQGAKPHSGAELSGLVLPSCSITLSYLIFLLSGAAALIYEISWSRQIGLLFGHTVHAAAVVLASYFSGMSVGYLVGAWWSSRVSPLFGYGIAECVVAGWACLIPVVLNWSELPTIAVWLSSTSFVWQTIVRGVFCFLLLLPATTALGVTLPMMAEYLSWRRRRNIADSANAARVALAYAFNTAGALVGVLFVTFYLLVTVGVRGSSYVAAGVSAVCGIVAWLLAWKQAFGDEGSEARSWWNSKSGEHLVKGRRKERVFLTSSLTGSSSGPRLSSRSLRFWYLLTALSGFGTLALEVLYTRMFSLVFHNSTYTFGAVVAVFLASLAVGAALASSLQRYCHIESLAGWATGMGALAVPISFLVFIALTDLDYYTYGESFFQYVGGAFLLVVLIVAPPVTLLGMLLPLVWKAVGGCDSMGRVVGRLTAINALASAVGATAASFLLLPWVGLWQSFALLAVLFYIAGFVLLVLRGRRIVAIGGALVLVALMLVVLRGPVESNYGRTQLGEQLVRRWVSAYGWIDVVRVKKTGSMKVRHNLHYRFGQTGERVRAYRQGHIPLLLHQRPQDVVFMGLGTGLTAGGAILHREVDNIVAVELIPEVIEAARLLTDHNNGVVNHPKVEIRVDDARHYLLSTDRCFDVIVSDLFVPWESESGYLYTVEHYRVARQRLKPGGLFCQWLPLYQVGTREFELIADSFVSVFPVTTIWWGQLDAARPIIALIGGDRPLTIDADQLATRLATLRQNTQLSDDNLRNPEHFFNNYLGDWSPRHSSRLNTDEHPRVEFLTPISDRDREVVRGTALLEYYKSTLSRLPSRAARLQSAQKTALQSSERRRALQHLILFGTEKDQE